ncbi:hypothetical protein [Azospirillum sp. sgz302134]
MITRISTLAAVMLLASPVAFAATTGSTTSPQSGAVTSGPGVTDQTATTGTAAPGTTTGRTHHAKRGGFQALDTNHDGVVDLQEWKAAGRKETSFNRIDADHSGTVTQAEMKSYRTAHANTAAKHSTTSTTAAPTTAAPPAAGTNPQ